MEKQNRSALCTLILVYLFGAVLAVLAFAAPTLAKIYFAYDAVWLSVTTAFYVTLPFAVATLLALDRLLRRILHGEVFVPANVTALRLISYMLAAATVIFLCAGFFYGAFFILAAATAFVVMVVRTVKNCFAAAVLLKAENELTI